MVRKELKSQPDEVKKKLRKMLSEIKLPPRSKKCVDSYNPKLGSDLSIYKCAYGLTIISGSRGPCCVPSGLRLGGTWS